MSDTPDTPILRDIEGGDGPFPVLPLRDIVVFPHMIVPLFVGREKSIRALEEVMRDDRQILLVAQKMPPTTTRKSVIFIPSEPSLRFCSC